MISLKRHLSWGLVISLIALLTLQWAIVTYAINKLTEDQLVERLQREGESLLAGAEFNASGQLLLDAKHISAVYQRPFSGHYYVLFSDKQRYTSRSLWDTDLNITSLNAGEHAKLYISGPEQQPLLVNVHGYRKQQGVITIAVAENLANLQASVTRFQMLYAVVSLIGLFALLAIQRLVVLNALRPLQQIQESMAKLASGEESQICNNGPVEVAPLIEEMNRLLTAVQNKSRRSRESLGNLAHALKTKLTLLNQAAERPELTTFPEIRNEIYSTTKSISQTIEHELKRARLLGDTHPARKVDLRAEVAQLVHTLRQIYQAKGVSIKSEITPEARFYGDREDLLEILGNLLDNACKWCRSSVSLTISGNTYTIFVIEDDGPGCAEHELNLLTRRGFRADESMPGSGLGLAIAHDIVDSYGAQLSFSRSAALGGLRVEVRFSLQKS